MAAKRKRQDPLEGVPLPGEGSGEPAEETGQTEVDALDRRPGQLRQSKVRPAERRRRKRRLNVTFSDAAIPDRLRELASKWGLLAPDGTSPNVSAVVEHLLLPQIEAAEKGKVKGPEK